MVIKRHHYYYCLPLSIDLIEYCDEYYCSAGTFLKAEFSEYTERDKIFFLWPTTSRYTISKKEVNRVQYITLNTACEVWCLSSSRFVKYHHATVLDHEADNWFAKILSQYTGTRSISDLIALHFVTYLIHQV